MRLVILLVLVAFGVLSGFGAFGVYTARTKRAEAETFLLQLGTHPPEGAYRSTTRRFQQDFAGNDFTQFVRNFELDAYQPGSFEIESSDANYESWQHGFNAVTLVGHATVRPHTPLRIQMKLREEDGTWKVDYFYVSRRSSQAHTGTNGASAKQEPLSLQTPSPALDSLPNPGVEPIPNGGRQHDAFPSPLSTASSPHP